jgi:predicted small lipoprotein YifL
MKKIFLSITLLIAGALFLTACGSGGDTYVAEGPAAPEIPVGEGQAFIVQASGDSSAGMSYTEVGDGSILVDCGDGDKYNCEVITAEMVPANEDGASDECSSDDCE